MSMGPRFPLGSLYRVSGVARTAVTRSGAANATLARRSWHVVPADPHRWQRSLALGRFGVGLHHGEAVLWSGSRGQGPGARRRESGSATEHWRTPVARSVTTRAGPAKAGGRYLFWGCVPPTEAGG